MYYDLLVRIKNAGAAKKETVQAPFSRFDAAIAKVLVDAGYLAGAEKKSIGKKSVLDIKLRYNGKDPVFTNFRFMSKPGKRVYEGYRELRPVKQHTGLAILSTPNGIMTNREARKQKVGGEYLFEVW